MKILNELLYAQSHEWVKIEGTKAYVGISDYAQEHLGDVVFVDLPEVGREVVKGSEVAVLESVKAASDIYSPLSGVVVEINEALADNPNLINESPYDSWLVVLEIKDATEADSLLSATDYEKILD